jgi:hypothetical protein
LARCCNWSGSKEGNACHVCKELEIPTKGESSLTFSRSKLSFLNPKDQKVWKRIWWALYVRLPYSRFSLSVVETKNPQVRDQQTSAALGLPPRIRDEDCQTADLDALDFEGSEPISPSEIFRAPPEVHIPYVIGMAQLARLCT